jgi:hypothetical protein
MLLAGGMVQEAAQRLLGNARLQALWGSGGGLHGNQGQGGSGAAKSFSSGWELQLGKEGEALLQELLEAAGRQGSAAAEVAEAQLLLDLHFAWQKGGSKQPAATEEAALQLASVWHRATAVQSRHIRLVAGSMALGLAARALDAAVHAARTRPGDVGNLQAAVTAAEQVLLWWGRWSGAACSALDACRDGSWPASAALQQRLPGTAASQASGAAAWGPAVLALLGLEVTADSISRGQVMVHGGALSWLSSSIQSSIKGKLQNASGQAAQQRQQAEAAGTAARCPLESGVAQAEAAAFLHRWLAEAAASFALNLEHLASELIRPQAQQLFQQLPRPGAGAAAGSRGSGDGLLAPTLQARLLLGICSSAALVHRQRSASTGEPKQGSAAAILAAAASRAVRDLYHIAEPPSGSAGHTILQALWARGAQLEAGSSRLGDRLLVERLAEAIASGGLVQHGGKADARWVIESSEWESTCWVALCRGPDTHSVPVPSRGAEAAARLFLLTPHLPGSLWLQQHAAQTGQLQWAINKQQPGVQASPQQLLLFAGTWVSQAARAYPSSMDASMLPPAASGTRPVDCLCTAVSLAGSALCRLASSNDWKSPSFISPATFLAAATRVTVMGLAATTSLHHLVLPRSMALLHMAGGGLAEELFGWLMRSGPSVGRCYLVKQQLEALAGTLVQILQDSRALLHWCQLHKVAMAGVQRAALVLLGTAAANLGESQAALKAAFAAACAAAAAAQPPQQRQQKEQLPIELQKMAVTVAVEAKRFGRLLPYDWQGMLMQVLRRLGDPPVRLQRR